jgi:hypothetical protein
MNAKKITSYYLPISLIEAINKKSFELTVQRNKRVTSANVIEEALRHIGVTANKG